jgi:hypothetical protein
MKGLFQFTPSKEIPHLGNSLIRTSYINSSCLQSSLHQQKALTNKLTNFLEFLIDALIRSRGTDVFIEINDEPSGLFSFTFKKSGVDREWRRLGLNVVASPLQMSPQ